MKVGVLASGSGTNLQALIDADVGVVAVGSDKPGARALQRASAAGLATAVFARDDYATREVRDAAMADWLREQGVELVVLAGYMQLVSPGFLHAFPDRVINVHPALLPAFPGIGSAEQAIAYGVKVAGVTVHFVDEGVDTGAIIFQAAVPVEPDDDGDALRAKLQPLEHELLPEAVRRIAAGRVRIDGRRVVVT